MWSSSTMRAPASEVYELRRLPLRSCLCQYGGTTEFRSGRAVASVAPSSRDGDGELSFTVSELTGSIHLQCSGLGGWRVKREDGRCQIEMCEGEG